MSAIGDFHHFETAFPNEFVPDVLRLLLAEWPKVTRPDANPLENRITNRFVGHLRMVMRKQDRPHLRFDCRPKLTSASEDSEVGEIDIQVTSYSPHPDAFLVIECKRLNTENASGFQSGAGEYVGKQGMGRFISKQYESGGDVGVMLGYVMTRTIDDAMQSIDTQLAVRYRELKMLPPFRFADSKILPNRRHVKQTTHNLDGEFEFVIVHALVHFSKLRP